MTLHHPRFHFVLTFHGIGKASRSLNPGEEDVWLPKENYLDALALVAGRANVTLTFDDGNASDFDTALEPLLERGLSAEFFVCANTVGSQGYLDRAQLRALTEAGMQIGTHGSDHRSWRSLPAEVLKREVSDSRSRLEDSTGAPVTHAACPFGAYDRRVLTALQQAGYARVYTSDGGPARRASWLQGRTTIKPQHDEQRLTELLARSPTHPAELWRRAKILLKRWR